MVKIKVPGTSANIGPGFDTLGLALNIFNEITVEKKNSGIEVLWDIPNPNIPLEDNLVYVALVHTLKKYKKEDLGCTVRMTKVDIPISRGLGSSAAAIVCGIYAAHYLMDYSLSTKDIVNIATELEGHPDNVAPAILGNMILSVMTGDSVLYSKIDFPEEIKFNVLIPNFKLSTEKARSVLPGSYSTADCVSNASRLALMLNFLKEKRYNDLRVCLEDKIHQPYRFELINNSLDIFEKSKELGALGEFISGAGPTLITWVDKNEESYKKELQKYLDTLDDKWEIKDLTINTTGTIIEEI
ncbi:MAG: homoserine kinase [Fusobacteriaceae bacterium]|jgi:homoserine kinase|nr:homoserine kinase [Fusobacteriaceae bacterium]MBP6467130.1 homoserine kinase [Fusobacteriaceae bacterium]MBP9597191.1 homoserine kinase [Fusobacteriaceae bacterium]MBU9919151.1 homoserine kinase [Fusobacteriaceae bacterium]